MHFNNSFHSHSAESVHLGVADIDGQTGADLFVSDLRSEGAEKNVSKTKLY